ncbi:helix-turn-helix domain-containing protein [Xylophilus rhododendri]|uniref:Helix-turn-helix domain-containing protein n=1 Tax=Xylophilus rhododendri TaxID=2697032 RepID=A0A857J6M9_9BURK|nr:IclR family transcriptional regulator [Xylophilus rhododendri]QHI98465.1 helix-turn-helix domain-containing protein [Xylophilus rhododendri]
MIPTDSSAPAASADNVNAVTRSLGILGAFGMTDSHLSLAELARRTAVPKPTVLRLARTLAQSGYLVALEGGAWRLGPAAARLGAQYQRAFDLRNLIEPALQQLADDTGHSTSFFALEDKQRVRLLRVRGKDGFVSPTRVGEPLPLEKGAAGQVILAFSGGRGHALAAIRERGWHLTVGEADAGSASIAAPVFVGSRSLLGAVSVAAPANEKAVAELERHSAGLVKAAGALSRAFGSTLIKAGDRVMVRSLWYPE